MFRITKPTGVTPLLSATIVPAMLLMNLVALPRTVDAGTIDFSTYAAVAFSPSTGKYGYCWDSPTRGRAEQEALSKCPEKDARIVGWVQGGWLVLAIGNDNIYGVGWEYGDGATNTDAVLRAKSECQKRGGKVHTLVILCSGDIDPQIVK